MTEQSAYVEKLKAQIDEWNAEITKLEAQGAQVKASYQEEYQKKVAQLKFKRDELINQLDEVSTSSQASWEALKEGVESSWNSLKEGIENARQAYQ